MLNHHLEHLNRAISVSSLALISFDAKGVITLTQGGALAMLGRRPGDLVGESIFEVYKGRTDLLTDFRRALSGERFSVSVVLGEHTFDISYEPILEENTVVEVIAVATDVSGRAAAEARVRTAESELLAREARFRTSFDDAAIGMSLVALDGRWLKVNRCLCSIVGYSEVELLQSRFQDITHPDDLEKDLDSLNSLLAGEIDSYRMEKRYRRKDGRDVWILLSVSLVRDPAGAPLYLVSQIQDIDSQKRMEEDLRREQSRLQSLMDNLPDSIYFKDRESRFIQVNKATARLFGLDDVNDVIGKTDSDFFTDDHAIPALADERSILETGQPIVGKVEKETLADGMERWVLTTKMPMFDPEGGIAGTFGISRDVSAMKRAEAALTHQALHDPLTGLPNRNLLRDSLNDALTSTRLNEVPLSLFFLDVNRFKDVNDTFGHHYGDSVLQVLADRLQQIVGNEGMAARLGGDELAVMMYDTDGVKAQGIADDIVTALSEPFTVNGMQFDVGASVGIALYPDHGNDPSTLMRRADTAMYAAKRSGDGYVLYSPALEEKSPVGIAMTRELRTALATEQLFLVYQPQVRLRDHELRGVEALVRWQHPERGLISPEAFIPTAEDSGLIGPLTIWILNEALRQLAEWTRQGIDTRVCVNLSARSLRDSHLVDEIHDALRRWSVAPERLVLEITESAIILDPPRALDIITRLHDMDIGISIDDFGTGYTSLSYLTRLPVDEVKIDRSFVSDMTINPDSAIIVRSVIDLAHNLGIQVVAEGVEDTLIAQSLAQHGCEVAQGYYISRPLAAHALPNWLVYWRSREVA